MYSRFALIGPLFFSLAGSATAEAITYDVTVNTSSISGTAGSLDFDFNPGPLVTQAASLQIQGFNSDGTLAGSPVLTGDVSGALPGTPTFDNGTGFNDYFEGFTYGNRISFDVSLYGPALSAPDGVSTSGSTFAVSMFSDASGTIPVLTTDTTDGFAFTVDVNLDGTTTVTSFSSQTDIGAVTSAIPEPNSFCLVLVAFGLASTMLIVKPLHGAFGPLKTDSQRSVGGTDDKVSRVSFGVYF